MKRWIALLAVVGGALTAPGVAGAGDPDLTVRGIARLHSVGGPAEVRALTALGLRVQPLQRLPLAIVEGPPAALRAALARGVVDRIDPDARLDLLWSASNRTMTVDAVHARGLRGEGMTVAIVDTGIDATHPDLTERVVHNVRIVDAVEAARLPVDPPTAADALVVAVDEGPGSNTDEYSGHGTAVASVVAADGSTGPTRVGVAPAADLVGYSVGPAYFAISNVLAAYDHILDHPEWGIDVVNNSFGADWLPFDPDHPVHVATRALDEHGVAVVFAAGNWGSGDSEMSLNGISLAPWVIRVASTDASGLRSDFSSLGLRHDGSEPVPVVDGHARFEGDRVGMYQPTISAPGGGGAPRDGIEVACGASAAAIQFVMPCVPGRSARAQGTSLAAPQVAGAVALLRQANPALTTDQVRDALIATAGATRGNEQMWQVGYGMLDAQAAVDLVRGSGAAGRIAGARQAADARALAGRDWAVTATELWSWTASPAATPAKPEIREFDVAVPAGTRGISVALQHPTTTAYAGVNSAGYTVTVTDAAGAVLGVSTASPSYGSASLLVELPGKSVTAGLLHLQVRGSLAGAGDPINLTFDWPGYNRRVNLAATLLRAQSNAGPRSRFVPSGQLDLRFTPDAANATALPSPEGCQVEAAPPRGGLAAAPVAPSRCHSATWGYATVVATFLSRHVHSMWTDVEHGEQQHGPALFRSQPFPTDVVLGGPGRLVAYVADALVGVRAAPLWWEISAVAPDGAVVALNNYVRSATGPVVNGRNEITVDLVPVRVPAGTRLQVCLLQAGANSSTARFLYGGAAYGDAGIRLATGHLTS